MFSSSCIQISSKEILIIIMATLIGHGLFLTLSRYVSHSDEADLFVVKKCFF